jgi:hypothetical protein
MFRLKTFNYNLAVTTDIDHAVLEIDKRVRDISLLCSKLFTTEVGLTLLRPYFQQPKFSELPGETMTGAGRGLLHTLIRQILVLHNLQLRRNDHRHPRACLLWVVDKFHLLQHR